MFESLIENPLFAIVSPAVRYLVFAGAAYGLVWKLMGVRLAHRRTSAKALSEAKIGHEIRWSLLTMLIFGLMAFGVSQLSRVGIVEIYADLGRYGVAYLVLSAIALIVWHDTYFYFTHRAFHHPLLFRFHKTHHESTNPSPWAAFSFHPVEAVINAGVLPLALLAMPLHPLAIGVFLLYTMGMNVMGHLGHEVYPRGFERSPLFAIFNTTTHHAMHHRLFNTHYGLYFNLWDRWMGTNRSDYAAEFARNTALPSTLSPTADRTSRSSPGARPSEAAPAPSAAQTSR